MWLVVFFFFKQKTAYELRISDWSSDVCSFDLATRASRRTARARGLRQARRGTGLCSCHQPPAFGVARDAAAIFKIDQMRKHRSPGGAGQPRVEPLIHMLHHVGDHARSEEHTSELQSLMRISYAVFCLKKK